tara:strand:- start:13007 stop:15010 length:2004 start_codon:yes stop_codon:yes gene_type:complete
MADNKKNKGRNPLNQQNDLFKALTRLFSGPIVNYRSQTGTKIRRQHLDKFSSRFRTASGQQFKKSQYSPLDNLALNAMQNQRRVERYIDFDQMEYMPEIASALDIYADEMTTYSDLRPMLNIKCSNEEIKAVLSNLYSKVLNVEYNLFGWARTMCKYGDFFLYLDMDDKFGVQSVISLPITEVERLEGQDSTNPNYIQYQWNSAGMTFENWQVAHFRVLGNDKHSPYGTSILDPARRIFRQLTLVEDAMMAYRVIRSSERRLFKIDVGGIPPNDIEQYMEKIVSNLKRHSVIDQKTGRVDMRYNPMSIEEDYFIPVRPGSATDVTNLAGGQNTAAVEDVKYLRDKLFAALKIPQPYLSMGEGAAEDKTTLAQKDIRFARTIQRLQRVIIHELEKIGIIHLYTLGFRGDDLINFKLALNNPSKIAEMQEIEFWKAKFDIAASATEGYFSRRWVTEHIFGMSNEEFVRNQREIYYDRKYDASLQQVAEAAATGETAGALGGDVGGDLGGDLGDDLALDDVGVDAAGGAEEMPAGDADAGGGDDSPLLAVPPGSRDSKRLSTYEKSSYVRKDGTNDGRKSSGPRQRNIGAQYNAEKRGSSTRSKFQGASGLATSTVPSIAKGIYEQDESTYNLKESIEEQKIFEVNDSLNHLISSLEDKQKLITEQNDEN